MSIVTESRVYSKSAVEKGPSYSNYVDYKIDYGRICDYKISEYLGKGKYSQVFKGKAGDRECIIKVLKPVREKKINREAKILTILKENANVVELIDVVRDEVSNTRSFVYTFEEYLETRELFKVFTEDDIRYYSKKILETLDYCHARGIMHRDIKPQNLVINHRRREMKIIDWGLAEFYIPRVEYSIGVGSMHYKSPELLVGYKTYDYGVDIWAFGCVFGEMVLTQTSPIFEGGTNAKQIWKIVSVLGSESFLKWAAECHIAVQKSLAEVVRDMPKEGAWDKFIEAPRIDFDSEQSQENAFDLLSRMLEIDHRKRASAKECLAMPFFKDAK